MRRGAGGETCVLHWQGGGRCEVNAGVDAALIGLDFVALAALAGAATEPAMRALCSSRRLRAAAGKQHALWTGLVDRAGATHPLATLALSVAATATEWFLIGDLIWSRFFHALWHDLHVGQVGECHGEEGGALAVLIHGLDSDASSLALLAQVLVLHGLPVALCDYHADGRKGYLHTADESVDAYAAVCMAQVRHLLQPASSRAPRHVVLIGCFILAHVSLYHPPELTRESARDSRECPSPDVLLPRAAACGEHTGIRWEDWLPAG